MLLLAQPTFSASLAPAEPSRGLKSKAPAVGTARRGMRERKREQPGRWNLREWIPTYLDDFLLQTKESGEIILYEVKTNKQRKPRKHSYSFYYTM